MLRIRQERHLAAQIGLDVPSLRTLAENANQYCEELELYDPTKPSKRRPVLNIRGPLRRSQRRIYKTILLPRLIPSDASYGGIRGRSIKDNAQQHIESRFVFTCDVSNFYPSVHRERVYRLFCGRFGCSPDVSRLFTRLCTFKHHLALGLITSPILADQILRDVDERIGAMALEAGLRYTRYVDDITVSGPFDLSESGFPGTMKTILHENGFLTNPKKNQFGPVQSPSTSITGIRINRGHLDASHRYIEELERQIADLRDLAAGREFHGPYYTKSQVWGRVHFVCWVNPGRRLSLRRMYGSVPWSNVEAEARRRGLVRSKREVMRATASLTTV